MSRWIIPPIAASAHDVATSLRSPLEDKVLRLFGALLGTKMIAEQLGLDREQVDGIKSTAMRKAGLTTRLQVITYVRSRNGQ